eukprot:3239477-Pyramimonas_sp.AAC.1
MKRGKSCPRSEMVVVEMFLDASDDLYETLASLFELRLLNDPAMDAPSSWGAHDVHLIEKMINPVCIKKWRPIAVLS